MATDEFLWTRDMKYVMWGPTLMLNSMRAFSAGLVFMIISLLQARPDLFIPFAFVIGYTLFLMPVGLVCGKLANLGVPFIGLVALFLTLGIVLGDPLVYLLFKVKKEWKPVDIFGVFNFALTIFVLDEALRRSELSLESARKSMRG